MTRKNKLKRILSAFTPDSTREPFDAFQTEVDALKKKLKQKINIATLNDVKRELARFQEKIDFSPLISSVENIDSSFEERQMVLSKTLEDKEKELRALMESSLSSKTSEIETITDEISDLKSLITEQEFTRKDELTSLNERINDAIRIASTIDIIKSELSDRLSTIEQDDSLKLRSEELGTDIASLGAKMEVMRLDLLRRLSNLGGGAMNRQILIAGNDPLTKYTDINLRAGSNVTITYTNDDVNKRVDITIAASGSGGAGITREINNINTDTTGGSTADIDYVYLCTDALTFTLPTAVGNENLYTIKRVGTGSVIINTTGGQTIDGETEIELATQYTSVDLISNGADWRIT